ncbi:hypothetical protein D3C86_1721590 [compost metagenome]
MDHALEADAEVVAEEPKDRRMLAEGCLGRPDPVLANQGVARYIPSLEQPSKLRDRLALEPLVGVEHEDPVTGGVFEGGVAGGREVAGPGCVEHPGAMALGDGDRPIGRAGVDHDDLVHAPNACKAAFQVPLLVLDDHAETE